MRRGQPIKKGTANRKNDTHLSHSLSSISRESSDPTILRQSTEHSSTLSTSFKKGPRKPSFDRGGWHLQKVNRSKVEDVANIREKFV